MMKRKKEKREEKKDSKMQVKDRELILLALHYPFQY